MFEAIIPGLPESHQKRGRRIETIDLGGVEPFEDGVTLKVDLIFEFQAKRLIDQGTWKRTQPDVDNLAKNTLDILKNNGLFKDEAVVDLRCRKVYGVSDRTHVQVVEIEPASGFTRVFMDELGREAERPPKRPATRYELVDEVAADLTA